MCDAAEDVMASAHDATDANGAADAACLAADAIKTEDKSAACADETVRVKEEAMVMLV